MISDSLDGVTAICIPQPEKIKQLDKTLGGLRRFFDRYKEEASLPAIVVLDRFGIGGLAVMADKLYEKDSSNKWQLCWGD